MRAPSTIARSSTFKIADLPGALARLGSNAVPTPLLGNAASPATVSRRVTSAARLVVSCVISFAVLALTGGRARRVSWALIVAIDEFTWLRTPFDSAACEAFTTSPYASTTARMPAIAFEALGADNDTDTTLLESAVALALVCEVNHVAVSLNGGFCASAFAAAASPSAAEWNTTNWSAT